MLCHLPFLIRMSFYTRYRASYHTHENKRRLSFTIHVLGREKIFHVDLPNWLDTVSEQCERYE